MTAAVGQGVSGFDAVIVLSYFGVQDTEACVQSLVSGSPEAVVFVIDNGSFDGVLERVATRWPQVATLQTGTNLGFAGGMNQGIRWALEAGADTITVLNNDTLVPPGAIAGLARVAQSGVAVSPEVRYADGTDRVWFGGGVIDQPTSLARHLSDDEIADRHPNSEGPLRPTEIMAGCCVTATARTWRRVGLFDERYFLNFEDSDWSVRAGRKGVPLVLDPRIVIHHRVSASFTGAYSYLGMFYYTRNGLLFGSSLRRWDVPTRLRFLRRHVLPVLGGDLRRRAWAEMGRHLRVTVTAVVAHVFHRYGRATRRLERTAARWSATSVPR